MSRPSYSRMPVEIEKTGANKIIAVLVPVVGRYVDYVSIVNEDSGYEHSV